MPACNFILKWDDVVQIPQRRPSYCWLDWKLFDVHISEIHSHIWFCERIKGKKESKGSVFEAQPSTATSSGKQRKTNSKPVSVSPAALLHPLSLLHLFSWHSQTLDCSCVCLRKLPPPSFVGIAGHSISTASLWKQPSARRERERKKKTPWAVKLPCHTKKESLLR